MTAPGRGLRWRLASLESSTAAALTSAPVTESEPAIDRRFTRGRSTQSATAAAATNNT